MWPETLLNNEYSGNMNYMSTIVIDGLKYKFAEIWIKTIFLKSDIIHSYKQEFIPSFFSSDNFFIKRLKTNCSLFIGSTALVCSVWCVVISIIFSALAMKHHATCWVFEIPILFLKDCQLNSCFHKTFT